MKNFRAKLFSIDNNVLPPPSLFDSYRMKDGKDCFKICSFHNHLPWERVEPLPCKRGE